MMSNAHFILCDGDQLRMAGSSWGNYSIKNIPKFKKRIYLNRRKNFDEKSLVGKFHILQIFNIKQ